MLSGVREREYTARISVVYTGVFIRARRLCSSVTNHSQDQHREANSSRIAFADKPAIWRTCTAFSRNPARMRMMMMVMMMTTTTKSSAQLMTEFPRFRKRTHERTYVTLTHTQSKTACHSAWHASTNMCEYSNVLQAENKGKCFGGIVWCLWLYSWIRFSRLHILNFVSLCFAFCRCNLANSLKLTANTRVKCANVQPFRVYFSWSYAALAQVFNCHIAPALIDANAYRISVSSAVASDAVAAFHGAPWWAR